MSQCTLCALGAQLDPSKTNVQIGVELGVSEASVRRHKAHAGMTVATEDVLRGVPVATITSRGRTLRLPDGSYEKVSWRPNAETNYEIAMRYIDFERPFKNAVRSHPLNGGDFGTAVNAADLQIGKAHQRGGGTPETEAQVKSSFAAAADRIASDTPSEVILADNGDIIENIWNTPQQGFTNDLDVPAQIFKAWNLMSEGIMLLAGLTPKLTVVAVPSNHGAARNGFKSQAGTVDADYGLMINQMLEQMFRDRDGYEHVSFVRPSSLYETAVVSACDTKVAYHHGHQAGKQDRQGQWWKGQDHGRMPGWDADILVTAHFHNMGLKQSGNGRWIISCSACEPSSDWFTDGSGESSKKGMTVFDFAGGMWDNPQVL